MNDDREFYKTLGLKGTETVKEIKAIYRELAKKYHPDVSKDEDDEKFKKIVEAYKVLSDEFKRSQYDKGEYVDEVSIQARAIDCIAQIFSSIIDQNVDFACNDLVAILKDQVKRNREQIETKILQLRTHSAKLDGLKARIDGEVLKNVVDGKIKLITGQLKNLDREIQTIDKMEEMLETYKYRVDEMVKIVMQQFSATEAGFGGGTGSF